MQTQPRLDMIDDLLFYIVKAVDKDGGAIWGNILENYKTKLKQLNVDDYENKVMNICAPDLENSVKYSTDQNLSEDARKIFKKIEEVSEYNLRSHTFRLNNEISSSSPLDDIIKEISKELLPKIQVENTIYERVKNRELIDYPEALKNLRQQFKEKIFKNPEIHGEFVKLLLSRVEFLKTEQGQEFGNWEGGLKNLLVENGELCKNNLAISTKIMSMYYATHNSYKDWEKATIKNLDALKKTNNWEEKFMDYVCDNQEYLGDADKVQPEIVNKVVELADDMVVDSKSKAWFFDKILLPICKALNKVGLVCKALNKVGLVSNETINDYESRVDKYNVKSWVNTIKSNSPAKGGGVVPN